MSFKESHLGQIRQKWGSAPMLFPGAAALPVSADGERMLLGYRPQLNYWTVVGGSMEYGEAMLDTLKREVAEETGCNVVEHTFLGLMTHPRYAVTYPHGDVTQPVNGVFSVVLDSEDVRLDEEHSEFKWFNVGELPENCSDMARSVVAMYIAFKDTGRVSVD